MTDRCVLDETAPTDWRTLTAAVAFVALMVALPAVVNPFHMTVLSLIFLFAYCGQAWNIMMGFAGQLSLGHALYFGVGSYIVAVLAQRYGISPWIGAVPAFVVCALLGAALAAVGFRFAVRGVYFALLTIAFAELVRILFEHWELIGKTGGFFLKALGADNNPLLSLRGGPLFTYYASLALLVISWVVAWRLLHSRTGYFWRAVREDEDAARALGVPAFRMKVLAVSISAGMTGVGGAWFGLINGSLFPETVLGMRMSIDLILAPIIGGLGSLFGPILGAFITVPLNELAKDLAQKYSLSGLNLLIYGLLLTLVVIAAPEGVWPKLVKAAKRLLPKGRRS
ncbi:MAG: branched-chain amino acid ABC transporter permease [Acidobacteria bacterium]|nr:branched-chain amino acid ABC transporter permease [Acidobacteriota bacterium]